MSRAAAPSEKRRAELAAVWGCIASLACCLAILIAVETPVPKGYAVCVSPACADDLVRASDGAAFPSTR
jgi:hypothetical protein